MTNWLASGAAMTTAVTDLITGIAALFLTIKLQRSRSKLHIHKKYWVDLFALLCGASILGFIAHAFLWAKTVYNIIWIFLYALLFETAIVFFALSICTFFGESKLSKKFTASIHAISFVIYAVTSVLPFFGKNGIRIFVVYAVLLALPGFALFALNALKNHHKGSMIFMLAFIPQIIGAVYQLMRRGEFRLIFIFDYNSIYHICLFVSIFIFYFAAKSSLNDQAAEQKQNGNIL